MGDRDIDRVERPRDEGVYSERIGEEKKEKEKYSREIEGNKKILIATFFSYLEKMFNAFSPSKKLAGKVIEQQNILEHLFRLKKLLKKLGEENLSNSSDFATELSDVWSMLIEDFDTVEIVERKNLQEIARFREMIDTIKQYPPDSDHRLGYYLLQHAGKDWLPFPFMEILDRLHKEHRENSKTSTLAYWDRLLEEVIENLKKEIPFKIT